MKAVLPMTYPPKIEAVKSGECRQTIRRGWRFWVGDEILFHGWSGKPYRSKWDWRLRVKLFNVHDVILSEDLVEEEWALNKWTHHWDGAVMNFVAKEDHIDPPTGPALKDLLKEMYGKDWEGKYQILVWKVMLKDCPCCSGFGGDEGGNQCHVCYGRGKVFMDE